MALELRPRERERALINLGLALPDLSPAGRRTLIRESAAQLGGNFFDMLVLGRLAGDDRVFQLAAGEEEKFGEFTSQLDSLLDLGRGLILLTGHIGCWELLGARIASVLAGLGRGPLGVVTGTVHNPPVDRLLQNRRRALGLKIMTRREGLRPLVDHVRAGGVAALLLDQKLSDQDPPVEFFGRAAPTPDGLARIALRLGTPILPVAMVWDDKSRYHVIKRESVLNREPERDDEMGAGAERVQRLQRECQSALERLIRRNPEQWVWFHDRWHSQG